MCSVTDHGDLGKEKSRRKRLSSLFVFECRMLSPLFRVVFIFSDARAHVIGFAIELALVLLGEMAVVFGHIAFLIFLQALFTAFQTTGFTRRELPILYAIGDTLLLIGFAVIDLVHARMSGIDSPRSGSGCFAVLSLSRS